jgi:hypothetical protein
MRISCSPLSRYSLHHPTYTSREAPPPTLLGDLLHALGYLLGRGVRPQFRAHFAHSRCQVQICDAFGEGRRPARIATLQELTLT